jgi:hypothetical protein
MNLVHVKGGSITYCGLDVVTTTNFVVVVFNLNRFFGVCVCFCAQSAGIPTQRDPFNCFYVGCMLNCFLTKSNNVFSFVGNSATEKRKKPARKNHVILAETTENVSQTPFSCHTQTHHSNSKHKI